MLTRAAILRKSPGKFEVVDIELDEPRQGELQVKMAATGLCHSDEHFQTGHSVAGHYPFICGHEGAGVIEAVGPGTPGWAVGDHVVFSFIPSCGRCRWCSEGMTNLCDLGAYLLRGSRFDDLDSFRFHLPDGTPVGQICGLGTFAERTTVSVESALKVAPELPLDRICLLGCGVGTGWGSAVYAAETRPGDVVIVMGTGGVGINAVQGAAHAGATAVIAVDPVELKRQVALEVGATHAFASIEEADEYAKSATNGQGADKAIITVGVLSGTHIVQALGAIRKAGTVVVTSVAPDDDIGGIPVPLREFSHMQKRIQGSMFGQCNPRADIPRQIRMYQAGQLNLDALVTRTYKLDEVVIGYEDMTVGRNIRGVIVFD
jgi:S-(hydroxymethyl)glutathione dehydrogenase/alcohol dehydrogenase